MSALENILPLDLDNELRRQMQAYGQRYDVQTGLLNYQAFQETLNEMLRDAAGREVALVWIDVLNLRREFALEGARGTEMLVARVAEALRCAVVARTPLGRYGSRCFLVALYADKFSKADRKYIQSIADALVPLRAPGSDNKVEIAAGVAFAPSDAETPDDLTRYSSLAASRAAYRKSDIVLPFRAGMSHHVVRDNQLEVEMRKSLERGPAQNQFSLVYQPKIELATGRVLGVEALIRWQHPELGAIAPTEFIPVAEHSDLIQRIIEFALGTALHDAQQWRRMGVPVPIVAVNMSWANLRRDDFVPSVVARLAELPIAPTELELEVTESVLLDDEDLFAARVRELKSVGVRVAIDDFGTRYTGFNVLQRMDLDAMKIDRCFIAGVDQSEDMRALCETIVAMARQLRLRSVAEGVEQPGELATLREIGCDAAQGYLFQRPVPFAELAAFLSAWPQRTAALGFRA
jgi:EAL domain-containing protein (putative c-di-GMP-specific phosphodiesterase class I)